MTGSTPQQTTRSTTGTPSSPQYLAHAEQLPVPLHVSDVIWNSIVHRPADTEAQRKFAPDSRFRKKLSEAAKGAAGGLTDLTYNLVKLWPEPVLVLVHATMCQLWDTKTVPGEWSRRWVHLKPKTETPL